MSLRSDVLSGLRWSAAAKLMAQLVTWVVTLTVIRLLEPRDYGLMAMAMVLIGFSSLLNEMGLGVALVQRERVDDPLPRQVFGLLLLLNGAICALLVIAAPLAAWFYGEPALVPLIVALSVQFIVMAFDIVPHAMLQRAMRFRLISLIEIGSLLVGSLVTLLLAASGHGVWALIWGSLANRLFAMVAVNLCAPRPGWPSLDLRGMRGLLTFGGTVAANQVLWFLYSQFDVLIIGRMLGSQMLGFYSVAMQLAALPMQKLNSILNQISFPAFARLQGDPALAAQYLRKAIRMISLFAFPVFFGMSAVAGDALPLLLGVEWLPAVLPVVVLALVMPLRMICNLYPTVLTGLGRADVVFGNLVIAALIMPAAILIGVRYGLAGVGAAWLLAFPVVFAVTVIRSRAVTGLGLPDVLAEMFRPALASAIMAALVSMIQPLAGSPVSPGFVLLKITAGAVVFVALTGLLNRAGAREALSLARS